MAINVDECLGSNKLNADANKNFYHYYSFSPCLYQASVNSKDQLQLCSDITTCSNDPIKYGSYLNYPTSLRLRMNFLGIALDGHMITGPFRSDNVLIQPCDVDACNGYTLNGHYVYASTLFYPYTVACWGPATTQSMYAPSCTNSKNVCSA